jgi:two-component system response regulator (stage 0 sporulation protein F)
MASKVSTVSTNKKIISVVDDEIDISKLFRDALCKNMDGVDVVSFNDPVTALEHFTDNKVSYALVISDLRMAGLNGLELLKKVKNSNSSVRTILMSAYNFEEDDLFQKYVKEGVIDSTIEKPVTIHRLCQRVKDELEVYNSTSHGN